MEIKIALKHSALAISCLLSLFFLGYTFKIFSAISPNLISQTSKGLNAGLLVLIAILFTTLFYSLVSFITEAKSMIGLFLAIGFVGYIFGFSMGTPLPNQLEIALASALFISLGLLRMVIYIRIDYLNSIKTKLAVIIPKNIHGFLVILGIVLSINFYIFFNASVKDSPFKIPENFLDKAIEPAIGIIEKNIETQINSQLEGTLEQNMGTQDKEELLKFIRSELEETFNEGTTRQELGFNQNIIDPNSITLTPQGEIDIGPVMETIKPTLINQLNEAIKPYAKYIPIILAFSLFFLLESLFSLFPFLIVPFIAMSFFLLKKAKFIKLIKSTIEVERYTL